MANINKWGVGQLNEAELPDGRKVYRADKILYKVGEQEVLAECAYDSDHFIFENKRLITKVEYERYKNTLGYIPLDRLGVISSCSCGSEAVLVIDAKAPDEIRNKLVCASVLKFGKHQTSFKIRDGRLILDKITAADSLMMDSDLDRLYGKEK